MYILVHQQNFTTNLSQSYLAISIAWSFFPCLGNCPIKFSAFSNLVSKSIQTTPFFIISFADDFCQGRVQISVLSIEWQLGLLPPLSTSQKKRQCHVIYKILKKNYYWLYINSAAFMIFINIFQSSLILHFCPVHNICFFS